MGAGWAPLSCRAQQEVFFVSFKLLRRARHVSFALSCAAVVKKQSKYQTLESEILVKKSRILCQEYTVCVYGGGGCPPKFRNIRALDHKI